MKRSARCADGLTRVQVERELRCRIVTNVVIARAQRRTVGEAGGAYIEHLESSWSANARRLRTTAVTGDAEYGSALQRAFVTLQLQSAGRLLDI